MEKKGANSKQERQRGQQGKGGSKENIGKNKHLSVGEGGK